MATVRKLLDDLTQGRISLEAVRKDFETRSWPPIPEPAPSQTAGVVDTPLPPADSVSWVQIHSRLTPFQRQTLLAAHDRATRQSPRQPGS